MSDVLEGNGSCLCGAVQCRARTVSKSVGVCHCSMCRQWNAGPLMTVDCGTEVSFEGEENIGVFGSSEWAERGFCRQCGSHLFYRLKANSQYMMSVGLFAADPGFVFDHQVFIDDKPAFYAFGNETTDMTGAEVFAGYAPL